MKGRYFYFGRITAGQKHFSDHHCTWLLCTRTREVEQLQPCMQTVARIWDESCHWALNQREGLLRRIRRGVFGNLIYTERQPHLLVMSIWEVEKKAYVLRLFANMQDGPKSIKKLPVLNWLREKEMHAWRQEEGVFKRLGVISCVSLMLCFCFTNWHMKVFPFVSIQS